MTNTFIAIDPGTYKTGVALFEDTHLASTWLCEIPLRLEIEERIIGLILQLEEIAQDNPNIRAVACEKMTTLAGRPPPAELVTLIHRLRRWATTTKRHRFAWSVYHPSTILSAVRPRHFSGQRRAEYRSRSAKELLRIGVTMLYGMEWSDLDQNVIDAIAVGHCHLTKTIEADILATRALPQEVDGLR